MTPNRFIFITGAADGIGKATARLFVKRGWYAGLFDLNEANLRDLREELGDHKCEIYLGDVCDIAGLEAALRSFSVKTNGLLHVLFNNAGILHAGDFESLPLEEQYRIVNVNINGVINGTRAGLPYLKKTPGARLISMSSASALFGHPDLTVYAASKAAVKSLTEGWSIAFEKYDIHVCDILPIYVSTQMVSNYMTQMRVEKKDVKLTPEKIARVVWKASKGRRMHWLVGTDTKLLSFLKRFFTDGMSRYILKKVIRYKN